MLSSGEEFLLSSRRIQPAKLLAADYQFRFPELEGALWHEMERLNVWFHSRNPAEMAVALALFPHRILPIAINWVTLV
jgi:hypothetical protein